MSTNEAIDRLWVPALAHYRREGDAVVLDADRILAHIQAMKPTVRQFLLAGSTGDGWQMTIDQVKALIGLTRHEAFAGTRFLIGALRPTTNEVVEWAVAFERELATLGQLTGEFMGFAVCPPIDENATQADIKAHYEAVLNATKSPIAVYQLPQVVKCRIDHATLEALAKNPRITMLKDTSGEDTVAKAGQIRGVTYVRGAEGNYAEALKPTGPYDGWLLSTANVFGKLLRDILEQHANGELAAASALSKSMTGLVETLFKAAMPLSFGNPFSNANRAADHIAAFGNAWREQPCPITISGDELPIGLLETAEDIMGWVFKEERPGYIPRELRSRGRAA